MTRLNGGCTCASASQAAPARLHVPKGFKAKTAVLYCTPHKRLNVLVVYNRTRKTFPMGAVVTYVAQKPDTCRRKAPMRPGI